MLNSTKMVLILAGCVQSVNDRLKEVAEQRGLSVLSFGEGIPTTINNMLPKLTVTVCKQQPCTGVSTALTVHAAVHAPTRCLLGLQYQCSCAMQVVPEASSYPGYGDFVLLKGIDHISVCKPPQRSDLAYLKLMDFLRARVQETSHQADITVD